jgi:hypothetical protein
MKNVANILGSMLLITVLWASGIFILIGRVFGIKAKRREFIASSRLSRHIVSVTLDDLSKNNKPIRTKET